MVWKSIPESLKIKDKRTRKQEIKLYPFTENMILYIETTKKNPPKTYET